MNNTNGDKGHNHNDCRSADEAYSGKEILHETQLSFVLILGVVTLFKDERLYHVKL